MLQWSISFALQGVSSQRSSLLKVQRRSCSARLLLTGMSEQVVLDSTKGMTVDWKYDVTIITFSGKSTY